MPRRNRRTVDSLPREARVLPHGSFALERAIRLAEKDRHRTRRNRAASDRSNRAA